MAAIAETSALVAAVIAELQNDNPQMPTSDELAARVAQLRDTLPEPEMMHTLFSLAEDEAREPVAAAEEATGADTLIDFDTTSIDALPSTEPAPHVEETLTEETLEFDTSSLESLPNVEPASEHPQIAETSSREDDLTASFIRELEAKESEDKAAADAAAAAQVRAIEERMAREAEESAAAEAFRREAEATHPMPEETELLSFEDLAQDEETAETVELSSDRAEEHDVVEPVEDSEDPSSRWSRCRLSKPPPNPECANAGKRALRRIAAARGRPAAGRQTRTAGHGRRPARDLRAGRRRHPRSLRLADGEAARSAAAIAIS